MLQLRVSVSVPWLDGWDEQPFGNLWLLGNVLRESPRRPRQSLLALIVICNCIRQLVERHTGVRFHMLVLDVGKGPNKVRERSEKRVLIWM